EFRPGPGLSVEFIHRVQESEFHIMNRSFRQFVLDYQYPEEVAAWDQEIKLSSWRAVLSPCSRCSDGSMDGLFPATGRSSGPRLCRRSRRAATLGSLRSAQRNCRCGPGTGAPKTA